jgi:hypothetical protein
MAKLRIENILKERQVESIFINSNFKNLKSELKNIKIEKIT